MSDNKITELISLIKKVLKTNKLIIFPFDYMGASIGGLLYDGTDLEHSLRVHIALPSKINCRALSTLKEKWNLFGIAIKK